MGKLSFLVIGTNFISDKFCDAAKEVEGVELCAVYSRKTETGNAFAQRHAIGKVYTNLDEALRDAEIDAVYVASPTFLHKEHSIKAMRYGKNVLCEKPLAKNYAELSEMLAVSKEEGRVLVEAMRPAFDPALGVIEENLSSLGKIRRASLEFCQYSSRYDKFKAGIVENAFDPEIGISALSDIGIYPLWLAVRLFGIPSSVSSEKLYLDNGFLGMGTSSLAYEDKVVSVVYSKITDGVNPSVIEGEDATLIINKVSVTTEITLKPRGEEPVTVYSVPFLNNMVYEIAEFKKMTEGTVDFLPYLCVSEEVMKVADIIHGFE